MTTDFDRRTLEQWAIRRREACHRIEAIGIETNLSLYEDVLALLSRVRELEADLQEWRECALYDVTMEGPVFKSWDRSALDRCRRKGIFPRKEGA